MDKVSGQIKCSVTGPEEKAGSNISLLLLHCQVQTARTILYARNVALTEHILNITSTTKAFLNSTVHALIN